MCSAMIMASSTTMPNTIIMADNVIPLIVKSKISPIISVMPHKGLKKHPWPLKVGRLRNTIRAMVNEHKTYDAIGCNHAQSISNCVMEGHQKVDGRM